jgi:hypothetical protein
LLHILEIKRAAKLSHFRSNQISDISPLASLTNLIELIVDNNPLDQESTDVHMPALMKRGDNSMNYDAVFYQSE